MKILIASVMIVLWLAGVLGAQSPEDLRVAGDAAGHGGQGGYALEAFAVTRWTTCSSQ